MKIIDSRVVSVRSARVELVLIDGTRHSFDLEQPVTGSVTLDEDEIDTSTFRTPGDSMRGRRVVEIALTGTLATLQRWGGGS